MKTTTKENLKRILMNKSVSEVIDIYMGMFGSKEECINNLLNHTNDQINKGLKEHQWDFEVEDIIK